MPVVSGEQVVGALSKFGYVAVRQKGSYVRLRHANETQRVGITIPIHKEVAFGTLRRILRDARITVEQFVSAL